MRIKLQELRKEVGLTQEQLAKKIKCSPRQFRRYESGSVDVPFNLARKWARKLGIDMNKFEKLYNKEE